MRVTGDGLDAAAIGLGQLQQQAENLAIGAGFSIGSGTADRAAGVCRRYAESIRDLTHAHCELREQPNFGACWIGNDLALKFQAKANGASAQPGAVGMPPPAGVPGGGADPNTLVGLLEGVVNLLETMSGFFVGAGVRYQQTDEQNARSLGGAGQGRQ